MGCCGKRRTQLLIDQKFFKKSLKVARVMRDTKLSELKNVNLIDYHRKCHVLYTDNIKNYSINKKFINSIVLLHNQIVKEMLKRIIQHDTPLRKV